MSPRLDEGLQQWSSAIVPHYVFFILLFVGTVLYGLWKGGGPERWAAGIIFVAVVLTGLAQHLDPAPFSAIQWGVTAVDGLTLIAFGAVALLSTRYWPMWVAALQIIQFLSDFTRALPGMIDLAYAFASSVIGYPICVLIVIATARHRLRTARYGVQPAWRAGLR
jgi:hypothetical protein